MHQKYYEKLGQRILPILTQDGPHFLKGIKPQNNKIIYWPHSELCLLLWTNIAEEFFLISFQSNFST